MQCVLALLSFIFRAGSPLQWGATVHAWFPLSLQSINSAKLRAEMDRFLAWRMERIDKWKLTSRMFKLMFKHLDWTVLWGCLFGILIGAIAEALRISVVLWHTYITPICVSIFSCWTIKCLILHYTWKSALYILFVCVLPLKIIFLYIFKFTPLCVLHTAAIWSSTALYFCVSI